MWYSWLVVMLKSRLLTGLKTPPTMQQVQAIEQGSSENENVAFKQSDKHYKTTTSLQTVHLWTNEQRM